MSTINVLSKNKKRRFPYTYLCKGLRVSFVTDKKPFNDINFKIEVQIDNNCLLKKIMSPASSLILRFRDSSCLVHQATLN